MPDLNSVPPSPRVLAASRQSSSASIAGIAAASAGRDSHNSNSNHPPPPASTASTSTATQMPPPPVPTSPSSIHVFPSNQMAVNQGSAVHSSALPSPFYPPPLSLAGGGATAPTGGVTAGPAPPGDGPGVGPGPGPLRHPRPLTAAELHMQLEKEQEAVVNRLTRELTLLRAQNASVVSNASSTSASGLSDAAATGGPSTASNPSVSGGGPTDHSLFSGTSGFSIPSSTGRHSRTYSNTSTRSQTAATGNAPSVVGITAPAPIRPQAPQLSRQNSTASRRSRANSPGPMSSSYTHSSHIAEAAASGAGNYFPRPGAATPSASEMSPALIPGTARYEETAFYRAELENVKRENEALRRRIRELERAAAASASGSGQQPQTSAPPSSHHHHSQRGVSGAQRERRERRSSDASRGRSESVSTTASMSVQSPGLGAVPAVSSSASLSALAGSSLPTPGSVSTTSAAVATPASTPGGGGGGVGIAGRRESGRERVTSMLSVAGSVAGSVGVGVPEDEVRVGESAASAGLRGQESSSGTN